MTPTDYDGVWELWSGTPGVGLREMDDSRNGILRFLRRNPDTNFVATEASLIVGTILCGYDGRRGYIYHVTVHSDHRGCGIGRALVERVMASLEREGVFKASLVVFSDNEGGNEFWERVGFKKRDDLYYRDSLVFTLYPSGL
jgi:ribosomal protein S18 acetylase RimI-like enzyme